MTKYFVEHRVLELQVCKDLLSNFSMVQKEILEFCSNPESLLDYPNYTVNNKLIYDKYWKAAPISRFKGEYVELHSSPESTKILKDIVLKNKLKCPVTSSIIHDLETQGILSNAFISRLIPGSIINPHTGWTGDWIRVHLGISCDPDCKITVGDSTRAWEDGQILAFVDGPPISHSVVHSGTKERTILSFDISIKYLNYLGV